MAWRAVRLRRPGAVGTTGETAAARARPSSSTGTAPPGWWCPAPAPAPPATAWPTCAPSLHRHLGRLASSPATSVDKTPDPALERHGSGRQVPRPQPRRRIQPNCPRSAPVSASDAWAVGDYSDGAGSNQTLILQLETATKWAQSTQPKPPVRFSFLADVAATSARQRLGRPVSLAPPPATGP